MCYSPTAIQKKNNVDITSSAYILEKEYQGTTGWNCPCQWCSRCSTAASKQAGGITFTDKDGNIIIDNDDKEEENVTKEEPRPVANSNNWEHPNYNRQETTHEDIDQANTGVEEQD